MGRPVFYEGEWREGRVSVSGQAFRAVVASSDAGLAQGIEATLVRAGATEVLRFDSAVDALEAAFDRGVHIAVLDEELGGVRGSEIAAILRDVAEEVEPVVVGRGQVESIDVTTLDPTSPNFEAALFDVATRVKRSSAGGD